MDFSLTEEQQLLKNSVERYLENYSAEAVGEPCWPMFTEMGWLAMPFPEEQGGFGGGIVESCLLMEAFGRSRFREPYWASVLLAGRLLAAAPESALRTELLEGLMAGSLTLSCALSEAANPGLDGAKTCVAEQDKGGWRLCGKKLLVSNPEADYFLVVARGDDGRQRLFAVEAGSVGMQRQNLQMMDRQPVVNLAFEASELDSASCLFEGEAFSEALQSVLEEAIVALAAEAVGAMEALLRDTVEYLKTRKQFGVAIGSFQALQHRVVEMYTDSELCKAMLLRAQCAILDQSDERSAVVSGLKMMIGQKGRRLAEEAVQLHGGMGVSDELSVGDYLKRLMTIDACLGNAGQHQRRFCNLRYQAVA